ncbi:MAG: sulfatase-like hydrolase/transferase [Marinosulfonomonas sp.]|nr:sulfatase-like hydrolase/transferase [Marinosulfonomonas sp.]
MSSTQPTKNFVLILSDEHNRKAAGCYGHPFVKTPNIDQLAATGTRFTSAYCNSPICVPARASLATGRYVHDTGFWDNACPYTGNPKSWHELLRDAGVDVVSIGKLHFRGGDDYGFSEEIIPLHVVGGKGDMKALFRKELPAKAGTEDMAEQAGRGDSSYSQYDTRTAATADEWLTRRAKGDNATSFALFVSFVMPHFPLIAPEAYFAMYEKYGLEELTHRLNNDPPDHPTLKRMFEYFDYDQHFDDEKKATALRAYYGMVTRMDELVGDVVKSVHSNGYTENTTIVYASDHGDNLGNRGMWGKSVMYEDSVGVPMIISGPGVPKGVAMDNPVTLLDIAPTAAAAVGVDDSAEAYVGTSLIEIAFGADPDRPAFAEYHASGSDTGQFMLRKGHWKLVYYVGAPSQLFDLRTDPDEASDLAGQAEHATKQAELEAELRKICDPEEQNRRAFADQAAMIDAYGGRTEIEKTADIPFTPAPE